MSEFINNSEFRQKKLKELIKQLHEGKTADEVKEEFQKHFGDVSTTEISQIEQALVKEGLPVEEIQKLCDVHASVFKGSISDIHATKDYSKIIGHPVNILVEENKAIEKLIEEEIKPHYDSYFKKPNPTSHLMLRIGFERLMEIEHHYSRKEYAFFPYLEKYEITAPPKVMWGVDDEIRAELKEVNAILSSPEINHEDLKLKIDSVLEKVIEMIFKENNILIPLMSDTFSFYDWIKIDESSEEFPFCLVKPLHPWKMENKEEVEKKQEKKLQAGEVEFDAGSLLPKEINSILNTLPIDITFVDANNKVKYFSQASERIFQRPKTIIGRDVALCHPPASVHVVDKIVDSFRSGEKDHEDFWIQKGDLFVVIKYYAVRDEQGNYLGTLEVTQNIKPLRDLEGEKRLLDE
ncbi:MAG: DUF438 domain-containing protein [Bacilli bacterium]|nr:DUF438 domain-containing protein [Bacilli bacterium]